MVKHCFVCHVPKVLKWLLARNYGIKDLHCLMLPVIIVDGPKSRVAFTNIKEDRP